MRSKYTNSTSGRKYVCVSAGHCESVDSRDASRRLCSLDADWLCSDDDDSLLDSEVSQLLRSQRATPVISANHSACKCQRQRDAGAPLMAALSTGRSLHAVAQLPRPSLDLYKMQVSMTTRRSECLRQCHTWRFVSYMHWFRGVLVQCHSKAGGGVLGVL